MTTRQRNKDIKTVKGPIITHDYDQYIQKCIDKWPVSSQIQMAMEECAELICDLNRCLRGRIENPAEELADAIMMIREMIMIFNCEKEVEEIFKKKLIRTMDILEGEKNDR